jgi:hypothetical protein
MRRFSQKLSLAGVQILHLLDEKTCVDNFVAVLLAKIVFG